MPQSSRLPLILASASPRRAELLRNAGIPFIVAPSDVPEVRRDTESAEQFVRRVAREKAAAVARIYPGRVVLGADTDVIVDEQVLGKPRDAADAKAMLRLLSGRKHIVMTAVTLLGPNIDDTRIESTAVTFVEITDEEISKYVASGEPMDKAGAYAIQGIASRWIPRIEGCYFNVVGLPVPLVYRMLKENGWV
ncbi:MAG: Maf family protein [Burkholderiales bacterium]